MNLGWRIQVIPYDDQSKALRYETNGYALTGALLFLTGIVIYLAMRNMFFIGIALFGFLVMIAGIIYKERNKYKSWKLVKAVCVDREIKGYRSSAGYKSSWSFRLVCEFRMNGQKYRVTPEVYWRSFSSESSIRYFLARRINREGYCLLYVNPKNPLQTELVGKDLRDRLVFQKNTNISINTDDFIIKNRLQDSHTFYLVWQLFILFSSILYFGGVYEKYE